MINGLQDTRRRSAFARNWKNTSSASRMNLLDEVELREAEEYLNSPAAKILGASPEARQLVKRSRKALDEVKKRQADELEEAQRRA